MTELLSLAACCGIYAAIAYHRAAVRSSYYRGRLSEEKWQVRHQQKTNAASYEMGYKIGRLVEIDNQAQNLPATIRAAYQHGRWSAVQQSIYQVN